VRPARLPAVHLRDEHQGQRLRGQPGRGVPSRERLAELTLARSYTVRRLAAALVVVIGVAAATFLLLHAVPGDPAREVLGEHASPSAIAALRHRWGLDRSLGSQFLLYLGNLLTLRLG